MYKAYRIEHRLKKRKECKKIGLGPYSGTSNTLSNMQTAHSSGHRPAIYQDFEDYEPEHYCCFNNLEQLEYWFDGFFSDMWELGYTIVEYDLSEKPLLGISGKQCIFHKNTILARKVLGTKVLETVLG